MENLWSIDSWRQKHATHLPEYSDPDAVEAVQNILMTKAPIVVPAECSRLQRYLAAASEGKMFVIQCGECAESFAGPSIADLRITLATMRTMGDLISYGTGREFVLIGRMAGQLAKPRSADTEETSEGRILTYRGDIINGSEPTSSARIPDPWRMVEAYHYSTCTMNLARSIAFEIGKETSSNVTAAVLDAASKHMPEAAQFLAEFNRARRYSNVPSRAHFPSSNEFFSSHEALLLPYEQAMTRWDENTEKWYSASAHMLWVGERTRSPRGAHVEFLRGISNPIGIKCGPTMTSDQLSELLDVLDPTNEPGRISLIVRAGARHVADSLARLATAVKAEGRRVVWLSDPMHGNTRQSKAGLKTRRLDEILSELRDFARALRGADEIPGGVHLEMTGLNVTECVGGSSAIDESQLHQRYLTLCDPRLNGVQAIDVARHVAISGNVGMWKAPEDITGDVHEISGAISNPYSDSGNGHG